MRILGLTTLALFAAVTSLAAPPLRPEIGLGSPPLEPVTSAWVMAAATDSDLFAVWSDSRPGTSGVFGTRIDQDGHVTNPLGVRLTPSGFTAHGMAWMGDSHIVVLSSGAVGSTISVDRNGALLRGRVEFGLIGSAWIAANASRALLIVRREDRTWAAFVDSEGKLTPLGDLPPKLFNIVILSRAGGFTVYAFDAGAFSGRRMLRFLIDDGGTIRDQVLGEWPSGSHFNATTDGTSDLLVWSWLESHPWSKEGLNTYLTTDFVLLNQNGLAARGAARLSRRDLAWQSGFYDAGNPAATWDGRRFTVSYVVSDGYTKSSLVAAGLTADGRLIEGSEVTVDEVSRAPYEANITVVFASTPSRRAMFWARSDRLFDTYDTRTFLRTFKSFDALASAPSTPLAGTTAYQSQPALASEHGTVYAVWRESRFNGRITAQRISPQGIASAPATLSDGTLDAARPAIAIGGGVAFTMWREDERAATRKRYNIAFRRIGLDGAPIDAAPVVVEKSPYLNQPEKNGTLDRVSVAWNGDHFVAAWTDSANLIHTMRIGADGIPLDFSPTLLVPDYLLGELSPKVIRVRDETLILFFMRMSKATLAPLAIKGVLMHRDGSTEPVTTFVDSTSTISETASPFAAEWNGTDLVIAWQDPPYGLKPACSLARRFALNGTPSGAVKTLTCESGSPNVRQLLPADLVWDGSSWWYLMTSPEMIPVAQKLDINLNEAGAAVPISPWGAGVGTGVGVGGIGRLFIAYPRIDESEAQTTRLFLQTIFTAGRERAANR